MIHKILVKFDMRDIAQHGWSIWFIPMLMITKATMYKALSKSNSLKNMLLEILYTTLWWKSSFPILFAIGLLQPPAPATNVPPAMSVMPTASPSQRSEESNGQTTQQPLQQTRGVGTPTNRRQKSWDLLDQTAIAQARQQKQHQVSLNRVCVS